MMEGIGRFEWPGGQIYEGGYKNDLKHGKGEIRMGEFVFKGIFENGKKEGEGILKKKDGKILKGIWSNDKLVQKLSE